MKNLIIGFFFLISLSIITGCSGFKWTPFAKQSSSTEAGVNKECEGIEFLDLYSSGAYGVKKYFARVRNNTILSRVVTVGYSVVGKRYTAQGIVGGGEIKDIELGVCKKRPNYIKIEKCK